MQSRFVTAFQILYQHRQCGRNTLTEL